MNQLIKEQRSMAELRDPENGAGAGKRLPGGLPAMDRPRGPDHVGSRWWCCCCPCCCCFPCCCCCCHRSCPFCCCHFCCRAAAPTGNHHPIGAVLPLLLLNYFPCGCCWPAAALAAPASALPLPHLPLLLLPLLLPPQLPLPLLWGWRAGGMCAVFYGVLF